MGETGRQFRMDGSRSFLCIKWLSHCRTIIQQDRTGEMPGYGRVLFQKGFQDPARLPGHTDPLFLPSGIQGTGGASTPVEIPHLYSEFRTGPPAAGYFFSCLVPLDRRTILFITPPDYADLPLLQSGEKSSLFTAVLIHTWNRGQDRQLVWTGIALPGYRRVLGRVV